MFEKLYRFSTIRIFFFRSSSSRFSGVDVCFPSCLCKAKQSQFYDLPPVFARSHRGPELSLENYYAVSNERNQYLFREAKRKVLVSGERNVNVVINAV